MASLQKWEYSRLNKTGWNRIRIFPEFCSSLFVTKNTVIDIDFKHEVVRMKNYTDRIPLRAFGVVENPSWADFEEFLKERCLPASRAGLKGILREMDVPFFDPLLIIEKTNGRMAGDNQWVQMIRNIAA